ncbi:MAG: hypothetical protein RJB39_395 [Candidatus Parcubacteria bacterium]|jgi:8-oxo-dGTP pyrophosphatase MutT (NUDIX family)
MELKRSFTRDDGETVEVIYNEGDPTADMEGKVLGGIHAFAFYDGKMVLVNHPKGGWMPPGGGREEKETIEEVVIREVQEETNMKILHQEVIGFQDIYHDNKITRQTRNFCIVEPYGEFVADPDGEIMEMQLIDPAEYKKYFDWGPIGDRIMERAMQMLEEYSKK